jgi:hypothetical protein
MEAVKKNNTTVEKKEKLQAFIHMQIYINSSTHSHAKVQLLLKLHSQKLQAYHTRTTPYVQRFLISCSTGSIHIREQFMYCLLQACTDILLCRYIPFVCMHIVTKTLNSYHKNNLPVSPDLGSPFRTSRRA